MAVSVKPKQLTTKIQLAGQAGSYKNDIKLVVTPSTLNTFRGTNFRTALIILSTWNWFDSTTIYSTPTVTTSATTPPVFTNDHQKPLSLQLGK